MTWGIFKDIAKIGKKIGKTAARIGKKIIHEVPKVIKFVRTTAAPVIKDVAHVIGGVSQSLAVPAGIIAGPEATAILEGVSVGAKATEGVAKAIEIEKKKPKGAKSHQQNPHPFAPKAHLPQIMVDRSEPETNRLGSQNPLMRGQQGGGIRTL
jgi:hypothetical protein